MSELQFENIRPYTNQEVVEALKRVVKVGEFYNVVKYFYPEYSNDRIRELALSCTSSYDFQIKFFHQAIRRIISNTSKGLTYTGFNTLNPDENYLFISNHRDIFLDAGILQIIHVEEGYDTSEITLGSNLMVNDFVTDIAKICKMYTVYRGGSKSELMKNSIRLSEYIRYSIIDKKVSSWIAQRNGRTKDGNDFAQSSLIKMLNLSGKGSVVNNFKELNIVAMSVSYEYEPCDIMKVHELYVSRSQDYVKQPNEDMHSIITGVKQEKGGIHFHFERLQLDGIGTSLSRKEQLDAITKFLTDVINKNYKLFPTNYIAYDLLTSGNRFEKKYAKDDKEYFINRQKELISKLPGDESILNQLFYEMYANPVINKLNINR